ncbi:MAG: ABC transporter permease [Tannerella sp.]|jgi:putative ABC transport system permease protein|nr:ABC transporter permease [Tannerella sp.]
MFEFDSLREIWGTMRKNKLRTFLTGFSVAWGIFMLIVLLAAGNGLSNGIAYNFRDIGQNAVFTYGRYTTLPWKGMQAGRPIQYTGEDVRDLPELLPEISLISGTNYRSDTLAFGKEFMSGGVNGVYPAYNRIQYLPVPAGQGRFINELDMRLKRKVIVLSPRMAQVLFRDSVKPLGQVVRFGGLNFRVVGIYKEENPNNQAPAYIPFSTSQALYADGDKVGEIDFTLHGVNSKDALTAFEKKYRGVMARRHHFAPDDNNAIGYYSSGEDFLMWRGLTGGVELFVWIVGIGTLMAGIVGVSNIMLISVRERTREFGIRKALGAKPVSILQLVVIESVLVTALFGYIGMLSGIGLSELVNYVMEAAHLSATSDAGAGGSTTVFRNPTVSLGIALAATGVLVVAGVLAGYFPARKAIRIPAIEAIREE